MTRSVANGDLDVFRGIVHCRSVLPADDLEHQRLVLPCQSMLLFSKPQHVNKTEVEGEDICEELGNGVIVEKRVEKCPVYSPLVCISLMTGAILLNFSSSVKVS